MCTLFIGKVVEELNSLLFVAVISVCVTLFFLMVD